MAECRLIAFDLSCTLQGMRGTAVHADLQPSLFEYAAEHPDTRFGIATNGNFQPAAQFIEDQGIAPLFGPEDDPYIAYRDQVVITRFYEPVAQPQGWRDRLMGREPQVTLRPKTMTRQLQAKPAPDLLLHLVDITESTPESTVFIGDQPIDQQTAALAGVGFVAFDYYAHAIEPFSMEELLQQAHALLPEY